MEEKKKPQTSNQFDVYTDKNQNGFLQSTFVHDDGMAFWKVYRGSDKQLPRVIAIETFIAASRNIFPSVRSLKATNP